MRELHLHRKSFEMLAFKSDVSHWRQKKEMVGVSIRYVSGDILSSHLGLLAHFTTRTV